MRVPELARDWIRSRTERPAADVPKPVRAALLAAAAGQVLLAALQPAPLGRAEALAAPPSQQALDVSSLGDPIPLAQLLTLHLQAFDNQPGVSIPFLELDYGRVRAWLERILALDPGGQYPLMLAAQVYSQVPDRARQREMLEFVYEQFGHDPVRRWPWLAHAAIMAKHRLSDLPLALRYAKALREQAQDPAVPGWARQMEIFLREEVGEYQAAKALLGGLLHSGTVTDPHELHFLIQRLQQIEAAEKSTAASKMRLHGDSPDPHPTKGSEALRNQ
jgi:hypothetical protein